MSESRTSKLIVRDLMERFGDGKQHPLEWAEKHITEIVEKHVDKILPPIRPGEVWALEGEMTVDHLIERLERHRGKNIGKVTVIDGVHETFCEGHFNGFTADGEEVIPVVKVMVPIPKNGQKSIIVDKWHTAPAVHYALCQSLKEVESTLAILERLQNPDHSDRELTFAERRMLPTTLTDLSREELLEQIDPWITLVDTLKDLIREFEFFRGEKNRE